MNLSFVGVIICFVGSFLGALGDKYVHDSYSKDLNGNYIIQKKKLWLLGIILSVLIDSCFTIVALYFTSAALVTPFAGVHILWNLIITNICLKIRTKLHQYMGSLFLICGIAVIITFSEKKVDIDNMDDLISMYSQIKVIIYVVIIFTIIIVLLFICLIPLCFQNMNNIRYLKKLKYIYTKKFLTYSSINQCGNHQNNSFSYDNVNKFSNTTDNLRKENDYDLGSFNNISSNNISGNNVSGDNVSGNNVSSNNVGVNDDKYENINNAQNVATSKGSFSNLLKANSKTNLNIKLSQDALEKLRLISQKSSVVIDKKEIYINLMNSYHSKDPISKIYQKNFFSSDPAKSQKRNSAKSTKNKNICKSNARNNKISNEINAKHKRNKKEDTYLLINKKNGKSKKLPYFFDFLRNKINKNVCIRKKTSSLKDCCFFQTDSNIEIDQNDKIKMDSCEYNNGDLLPFNNPQQVDCDKIVQREKLKQHEKSQEPLFYLHNQNITDANIIEVYDEHTAIRMQYSANSVINTYHKNGIMRIKENKENIQTNKIANYISEESFPLNIYVKKCDLPLTNIIDEDVKDANYSNNDETINNVITIDDGNNYNDMSNNDNSISGNRDKNEDDNNRNDSINAHNNSVSVDSKLQYMSFITTIYLSPQKKKKNLYRHNIL